jgi:murein DD-endopeptidase MepM/ murein hydrolase activator NlpD
VADGTVVFAGWNGGYGRLITIRHSEIYTTMYAHLSRFAKDLKKGVRVSQGDVIGYVGATGTATGPHLDFRMKRNGAFIYPLAEIAKQEGKKLDPAEMQAFTSVLTRARQQMTTRLAAQR